MQSTLGSKHTKAYHPQTNATFKTAICSYERDKHASGDMYRFNVIFIFNIKIAVMMLYDQEMEPLGFTQPVHDGPEKLEVPCQHIDCQVHNRLADLPYKNCPRNW